MPRPLLPTAALAAGLVAASLVADAASPRALPTDPTLAKLIDDSLAARPELRQARATVEAEAERVPQARALPDPMLQLGVQNDGFTSLEIGHMETSYVSIMASQTFPWPGKRDLRAGVARVGVDQAKLGVERVRLSTEAEVRRAYLDLVLVRDRLELLERLGALWAQSLATARARYEAGAGAQSDVLRAQLELKRLEQRRVALRAEERARVQALNRLRARPLGEAIATTAHVKDLPAPAGFVGAFSADDAVAKSPELASARLDIRRAGAQVDLAEKSAYPDLEVGAGIMIRGAMPPMWLVTVGGPLPIFSRGTQRRAAAEGRARARAAEANVAAIEQTLRLRSEERRTAFVALVETLAIYDEGLLVQSQATAESTLSQYKVGKVAFASVLEANAGFLADQEGYLQAIAAAYRLLIAEAELSLGPTGVDGGAGLGATSMPGAGAMSTGPAGGGALPDGAASPAAPGGGSMSGM